MRGKKFDPQFLTDFIGSCVGKGLITPEEMGSAARQEIEMIDNQIKKVEDLKSRRSKLLDVIDNFRAPGKSNKEEARILTFFQIKNPHICKCICDLVKLQPQTREHFDDSKYSQHDINFCIKQLLEHRVIAKVGNFFLRGEQFAEYSKFVLQEE